MLNFQYWVNTMKCRLPGLSPVLLLASVTLAGCSLTPVPLTDAEIAGRADSVHYRVTIDQEPVSAPIDLYEAMARALKYNLDHRVEMMQAAVRIKELDVAHYAMLPNVVAGTGYTGRNNDNASNSVNVLTGVQSLATSTSQEREMNTRDIAFSWNVLDFGLSYVRARQAADQYLIAEELRRKVVHRVIEDVRTAYWRTMSADRLLKKLRLLEDRVRHVQTNSRSISDTRQTSPITSVTYERELVEIKRTIQELERELASARTQLSSLMNLKPGTKFNLAQPDRTRTNNLTLKMPASEMITTALQNRAELREVWYKQRINGNEFDAALLELLPGLQLYAGTNYDSNDYLYNSHWLNWGAKASWNVIRVFQYPHKRDVIGAQDALLDERSLAIAMAVMTQVHVSRIRFHHFGKELKTANEYLEVQTRLVGLMRNEAAADRISEQTLIREEMNTLVAEVKRDISYANFQNAFANVYSSMGLDPFVSGIHPSEQGIKNLASALRQAWFERGDYNAAHKLRVSSAH